MGEARSRSGRYDRSRGSAREEGRATSFGLSRSRSAVPAQTGRERPSKRNVLHPAHWERREPY